MVFRQILVTNCLKRARKLFKKEKNAEKLLEGLKVAPNPKSCSKVAEQLRDSPIPRGVSAFYHISRAHRSLSNEFWVITTSKLLKNHTKPSGICFLNRKTQYQKIRLVAPSTRSHAKIVTRVISGKPNANFLLALKNTRKRWNINTRKSQL